MNERELDVVVLGGAGVDTVVYVPDLPLPFVDSYMVPAIETRAGHTGDNVAVALAALDLRVHHIDVVGRDQAGDLVRELHRTWHVPLHDLPTAAGTKRAVNLVDPLGRRLSLYDVSRAGDIEPFPRNVVAPLVAAARHVHVSITQPCQHELAALADAGVTVSTDLHNWDGVSAYHETFASAADIVFLSASALSDVESAMRRVVDLGRARIVVATDGDRGGYLLHRDDDVVTQFAATRPPSPVVDSNGAGDAFVAGFLYGFLRDERLDRCVRFGAVAGAHACTVPADVVSPITAAQLLATPRESTHNGVTRL